MSVQPIFPSDEYESRWNRVYDELEKRGFSTAVIWGRGSGAWEQHQDTFWLTGYYSNHSGAERDCRIWSGHGYEAVILHNRDTPSVHGTEYVAPIGSFYGCWHEHQFLADGVAGYLNDVVKPSGPVLMSGADILPYKHMKRFLDLTPGTDWSYQDNLVGRVSRKKSSRELDAMREAGETATLAMNSLMQKLIEGASEREAMSAASSIVASRGGLINLPRITIDQGAGMQRIVDGLLIGYGDQKAGKYDLIRAALMGPMNDKGYWLDPVRTGVYQNNPTTEEKQLVEGCAKIVEEIMALHKPGVRILDLWDQGQIIINDVISSLSWMGSDSGLLAQQWPLIGHDLGVMIRSATSGEFMASDDPTHPGSFGPDEVIEAGWVQSSEYFFGDDSVGYAAFEQNFIVTENGPELLTKTPMIFWD